MAGGKGEYGPDMAKPIPKSFYPGERNPAGSVYTPTVPPAQPQTQLHPSFTELQQNKPPSYSHKTSTSLQVWLYRNLHAEPSHTCKHTHTHPWGSPLWKQRHSINHTCKSWFGTKCALFTSGVYCQCYTTGKHDLRWHYSAEIIPRCSDKAKWLCVILSWSCMFLDIF